MTHAGGKRLRVFSCSIVRIYLPKLQSGEVEAGAVSTPTGALLSTVSFNEGKSVPGIAHAVVLETG